jgi:prolyl-tRNA editing enzyme YbaK/EbsC (Cys-tRNA(Pro) deacylase)
MGLRSTGDCGSSIRFGSGGDDVVDWIVSVKPAASPSALKVQAALGDRYRVLEFDAATRADAEFVREATGFAIGGVPPVGHKNPPIVLIDESLMGFAEIWAAAGTPNAVFHLTPSDLVKLTGGRVAAIARQQ